MGDKCPFCGRKKTPFSSNPEDHCRWVGKYSVDLAKARSIYCYEAQIVTLNSIIDFYHNLSAGDKCPYDNGECDAKVALKDGLAKAIKVVEVVGTYGIEVPHGRNIELATRMILIKKKAQAILPELRELAGEGRINS